MKHLTPVLVILLAAGLAHAGDTQPLSLTVSHDIDVGEHKSIATREFSFDITLDGDAASVTVDKAQASYTAHEMKQRLGTRHLPGQSFSLSDDDAPLIDLGGMPSPGYSVANQLVDSLPALPEKRATVGHHWTTESDTRSLEAWAWGVGRLTHRNKVTAVDGDIVSVTTVSEGTLGPMDGAGEMNAAVKRTVHWTFDAKGGRILTLTLEQEAEGSCAVPQRGVVEFIQRTRVKLAPRS
jgi:hypothetical protein